jgi:Ca-activated chloride channel family protein
MISRAFACVFVVVSACVPAFSEGPDRVDIVLDASLSMWERLGNDGPKIVALRRAVAEVLSSPDLARDRFEMALRTVGGHFEVIDDRGCADTRLVLASAPVDPDLWQQVLASVFPLGQRPLLQAIDDARIELGSRDGSSRLVIVTAGDDTCGGDLGAVIEELAADDSADVRIVGIGLDRDTANAATMLVPTRNSVDYRTLTQALAWALGLEQPRARNAEIAVRRGGKSIGNGELQLTRPLTGATQIVPLDGGSASARLEPGRYNLELRTADREPVRVAGFDLQVDAVNFIDLPGTPPVTLEVSPQQPLETGTAYIQHWGTPDGNNLMAVAEAESDAADFLVAAAVDRSSGEVAFRLPSASRPLEARMLHEVGGGGLVIVGRAALDTKRPTASVTVAESAEVDTPLTVSWEGPGLPGDHLVLRPSDEDVELACLPVAARGSVELRTPRPAGDYSIRYVNSMGQALARAELEVYEILATLDFRTTTNAGGILEVSWTGPGAANDHITLATAGADAAEYLDWAPVDGGSPLHLRVPRTDGTYEVRYVRAEDGEILAQEPLRVVVREIRLRAPSSIRLGTRFEVRWRGTPGSGDFVTITEKGAAAGAYLDWADTAGGSPASLAAPFEPGRYEVRYISGPTMTIVATLEVEVR